MNKRSEREPGRLSRRNADLSPEELARALAEQRRQWAAFNAWEAEEAARATEYLSVEERIAWYGAAYEFAARFGGSSEEHLRDLIEWVKVSRKAWRNLSVSKQRSPK